MTMNTTTQASGDTSSTVAINQAQDLTSMVFYSSSTPMYSNTQPRHQWHPFLDSINLSMMLLVLFFGMANLLVLYIMVSSVELRQPMNYTAILLTVGNLLRSSVVVPMEILDLATLGSIISLPWCQVKIFIRSVTFHSSLFYVASSAHWRYWVIKLGYPVYWRLHFQRISKRITTFIVMMYILILFYSVVTVSRRNYIVLGICMREASMNKPENFQDRQAQSGNCRVYCSVFVYNSLLLCKYGFNYQSC